MNFRTLLAMTSAVCLSGSLGFAQNYSCSTFTLPNVNGKAALLSSVNGLNLSGELVGNYQIAGSQALHGFFRDATGTITPLQYPGASSTSASGINASGEIDGSYTDNQGDSYMYLRRADGTYVTVQPPATYGRYNSVQVGGLSDNDALGVLLQGTEFFAQDTSGNLLFPVGDQPALSKSAVPVAINNSGQLLIIDPGSGDTDVVTAGGGHSTADYQVFNSVARSVVSGINNDGSFAGFWQNTSVSDSTHPQGADFPFMILAGSSNYPALVCPNYPTDGFTNRTHLQSINDKNQVAGVILASSGTIGFLAAPSGTAPQVQLSESSWDFAGLPLNQPSPPATITVTNTGNGPLHILNLTSAPFVGQPGAYFVVTSPTDLSITQTTCNIPVQPGDTCSISFQFKPTVRGPQYDALLLVDDSPSSPHLIEVNGFGGSAQSTLKVSNTSWTFSSHPVGLTSGNGKIYIYNEGPTLVSTSGFAITGSGASNFKILGTTCGSTLIPYHTCSVSFDFTPLSVGGHIATLNLNDNSLNGPVKIPVNGDGR